MTTLDQSPIFAFNILCYKSSDKNNPLDKSTTQGERFVLEQLAKWGAMQRNGEIDEIYPEINTLAKGAGVSIKTVERTLKKFNGILFTYESGKKTKTANTYEIFDCTHEIFSALSPRNRIKNWKSEVEHLKKELMSDEDFYSKKQWLSTSKCRTSRVKKCRTNKSYPNALRSRYKIRTEERAQSYEQPKKKEGLKFGRGYGFLKQVGVPEKEAQRIHVWYPDEAWFQAKNDLWWYAKDHTIYNPAAFMISRAKQHNKRIFKT